MTTLEDKVDALSSEMHAEFAAVRSEMNAGFAAVRAELRAELRSTTSELKAHMLMLHEQVLERFKILDEGRSGNGEKRPRRR